MQKREHIESFYRTSPGKFVIVLKRPNFKELDNHEINFKDKVGNIDHNSRILPKPPRFHEDITDMMKMRFFNHVFTYKHITLQFT